VSLSNEQHTESFARFDLFRRLCGLLLLQRPHLREQAARAHEFRVRPAFHDPAMIHYDNLLRMNDRGQPVRNDQRGPFLRDEIELMLDRALGF
jgi:hypothetical protein